MALRRKELTRLLRENGVTYNVYGSPEETERLWSLDLMPFFMESSEFSSLRARALQRGELLNALFKDLYGPRRLLFDRIVPPEVVYAAQGFLRQCHNLYQTRDRELLFFSSDLARRADGTFVVIGDRAQAPSGTGYSLENRIVLSRVFPSLVPRQRSAPRGDLLQVAQKNSGDAGAQQPEQRARCCSADTGA
jgi:uncharacterized circularly permuted ATP-grasp superfamily protein